jgi:mono/diheme cytochrome c family protein
VVFAQNCAACHGEEGEGRIGQTLATEFASAEPGAYVIDVVTNGVEGALMPAFGAEQGGPLSEQEIQDVSAYVLSLQPVGVSAEEGDVVQPVSGLPLAIAAIAMLALLLGLGLLTQRQSSRRGQSE